MKESIAILMTVHNRKEITVRCLNLIKKIVDRISDFEFDYYITNDGCSDGTKEIINERFPEFNIIEGDGNLFWCGGMRLAWKKASETKQYDFYLWVNDDIILYEHSLLEIITLSKVLNDVALICGAFKDQTGKFTYGGRDMKRNAIIPNGMIQDVYFTNGNLLLIPKSVFNVLGNIPSFYIHDMGDLDYGLRAIKNNIKVVSSLSYLGECEINPKTFYGKGRKMGTSLFNRLKYLYSRKGVNPNIVFRFNLSHFGIKKAVHDYIGALYYISLPDKYIIKKYEQKKH